MILGRVTGSVHATVHDPPLSDKKLLMIQPVDLGFEKRGAPLIAVDRAGAGEGDLVLMMKEGGSARLILEDERTPVQCVVVAVVDDVALEE